MSIYTKEYLLTLSIFERRDIITREYAKCMLDGEYFIEEYLTVEAKEGRVPFKLYPHQHDTYASYEKYYNNISMKTRQMGFTSFTSAYVCKEINFNADYRCLIISKTMTDARDFLKKIKDMLEDAHNKYPWLISDFRDGYNNKESFMLKNNSFVRVESTNSEAGRGSTNIRLLIVDEVASVDKRRPEMMQEIWGSVGPALTAVRGKSIMISTPRGQSGWYYNTYTNARKMGFHIIDAHWTRHPIYSMGSYQWIADETHENKGYIKFLNESWPESIFDREEGVFIELNKDDYSFILDGKVRSPWYDFESARLGPRLTKCELDCSFVGTGGEVLDSDLLREIQVTVQTSEYKDFKTPYANVNGLFKDYKEYIAPKVGHRYALGGDVATGDGEDYSAFAVIDIDTLEICSIFKGQLLPTTYAEIISMVGKRYNYATVIIENAGGGGTTLQDLKRTGYAKIFYSVLKKDDPATGQKKRKIGLWPSERVRREAGDRLEQMLRQRMLKNYSEDLLNELYTWIWDKDGKRRHAPGKNDDLIIGTQIAIYYIFYFIRKNDISRKIFQKIFEERKNGVSIFIKENNNMQNNALAKRSAEINLFRSDKYQIKPITNIDKESGMKLKRRTMNYF